MAFNRWEKRTLEKIVEVFFPPGVGDRLKRDLIEAGTVERLDYMISRYPLQARLLFHIVIWVTYWAPIFLFVSILPFNFLNWEKRKKAMEKMFYSRIYYVRQFANLLKLVAAISFFADEEARREVGIPGIDDPIYSKYMGG